MAFEMRGWGALDYYDPVSRRYECASFGNPLVAATLLPRPGRGILRDAQPGSTALVGGNFRGNIL